MQQKRINAANDLTVSVTLRPLTFCMTLTEVLTVGIVLVRWIGLYIWTCLSTVVYPATLGLKEGRRSQVERQRQIQIYSTW